MDIFYTKDEIRNNPSIKNNMETHLVDKYRKQGPRFIIDVGSKLGLRYDTIATGVVYFHRFYMQYSFMDFDKYVLAACCLFLAGKVEETPKKIKDIIKVSKSILTEDEYSHFGEDPKDELMTLERILLQTIRFDFNVPHPYTYLLKYIKTLKEEEHNKLQKIVQMTWTFINDSLSTTLCLQWEPEIIAIALVHLAAKLIKVDLNQWFGFNKGFPSFNQDNWWAKFVVGLEPELLEDICHQVLDLYSSRSSKTSFTKSELIEIEQLRRKE
ncbi:unnamed protein product [Gordionus sp. m RMFG-2023]